MGASQSVDVWDRVTDTRTLFEAFEKVRSNNGGPGGDGITVGAFRHNLTANLAQLSAEMREGRYRPGSYRRVVIPKRNGQARTLTIPAVADRVVHGAIVLVLEPILEPQFENCSFAYRKGRSVNQAVARIEMLRNRGYRHVVEADINDYFNSINHGLLIHKLKSILQASSGSQALQDFIADSLREQAEVLGTPGRGLVQGSPLSPLLANLYLDALDEEIEKQGVQLVRFADDFVVLCKSAARAEKAMEHIRKVLGEHRLTLHEKKTGLVTFDSGFEFLGHMFVRSLALKKKPQRSANELEEKTQEEPPVVEPEIGSWCRLQKARDTAGAVAPHMCTRKAEGLFFGMKASLSSTLGAMKSRPWRRDAWTG